MAAKFNPTHINLMRVSKTLSRAESGHDVLEKKRDILMTELRSSLYDAKRLREEAVSALANAYRSLTRAKVMLGPESVKTIALASSSEANISLDHRNLMAVTVPIVEFQREEARPDYGFADTSASLDKAFKDFYEALDLVVQLAESEGVAFRIANEIQETQKRVNALKFVLIPSYRETAKNIEHVLEEKEREELARMKMAKKKIVETHERGIGES